MATSTVPSAITISVIDEASSSPAQVGEVLQGHRSMTSLQADSPVIALRSATSADIPHVLAFIRELAEYEKLAHEAVADEATLATHLFGEHPAAEVVIAEVNGQPAGFALFFHNFSTFLGQRGLYLEDLFVRPQYRGLGLGKRLMVHLAQLATQRGCGRFEWSVLDWNEPAIRFYRSLGATGLDEWTVQRVSGDALRTLAGTSADHGDTPAV
jgi:GNAT superfamily N-acetyltransferase